MKSLLRTYIQNLSLGLGELNTENVQEILMMIVVRVEELEEKVKELESENGQ